MTVAKVLGLARHTQSHGEIEELTSCDVTVERGVEGDYRGEYGDEDRRVTVLFAEQWRDACDANQTALPWTARRANVLVAGMSNPQLAGGRLTIGEVELEVTQECKPCSRMDRAADGMRNTLGTDWRGGLACRVTRGGRMNVGDSVALAGDSKGHIA